MANVLIATVVTTQLKELYPHFLFFKCLINNLSSFLFKNFAQYPAYPRVKSTALRN